MLSNKTRITIISLVAATSLAVAAVPASAVRIVYEKGGWGHYICDIGNGVYIADGEEWKENGKTYTCKNGKITSSRMSSSGGIRPEGSAPPQNAPESGSPPPTRPTPPPATTHA